MSLNMLVELEILMIYIKEEMYNDPHSTVYSEYS